jgi:predicted permease
MEWLRLLSARIRGLLCKARIEDEIADELNFHLRMSALENARRGMPAEEARRAAQRRLGHTEAIKEACRDVRGGGWFESIVRDFRYAVRTLLRAPGFATIAIASLGVGIGASTAVFSLIDAIIVRPLPFTESKRLVILVQHFKGQNLDNVGVSRADFQSYQTQVRSFEKTAIFHPIAFNVAGDEAPECILGARVSSDLFPLLGIAPLLGRTFQQTDDSQDGSDGIIISEQLWRRRFHSDPNMIGRTISSNGQSLRIIGVMPASFEFPLPMVIPTPGIDIRSHTDIWQLLRIRDAESTFSEPRRYSLIARLVSGISMLQAQTEIDGVTASLQERYPEVYRKADEFGATISSVRSRLWRNTKEMVLVLGAAAQLLLLIACANTATMMLARTAARQHELVVRLVLGATRLRLVQQLLTESLTLALGGCVIGTVIAGCGIVLLKTMGTRIIPRISEINLDWRTLTAAVLVSIGAGIITGLIAAIAIRKARLNELLNGPRVAQGMNRGWLRNSLVVAEIALAFTLLSCAGLLTKSFISLSNVKTGFNPRDVITFGISLPRLTYPTESSQIAFYRDVERHVAGLPEVERAAFTTALPMSGAERDGSFRVEQTQSSDPTPNEQFRSVSPEYFRVLEIPLVQGRFFGPTDTAESSPVVIINQAFAKRYWPGQQPIGQRIAVVTSSLDELIWGNVVGVVANTRDRAFDAPIVPQFYRPLIQYADSHVVLVVRSRANPRELIAAVRSQVAAVDHNQPVASIRTFESVVGDTIAVRRGSVVLTTVFAGIALLLAAVGIYGVMSYLIGERRYEIGMRMALGSQRTALLKMFLCNVLRLLLIGIGIGALLAVSGANILSSALHGVKTYDFVVWMIVAVVTSSTTLLASFVPVASAIRLNPMNTLRHV